MFKELDKSKDVVLHNNVKIGKMKILSTACQPCTCAKTVAYNFVDFRVKHAGSSNYRKAFRSRV